MASPMSSHIRLVAKASPPSTPRPGAAEMQTIMSAPEA